MQKPWTAWMQYSGDFWSEVLCKPRKFFGCWATPRKVRAGERAETSVFFFGAFAISRKATNLRHFCPSVCPHGTDRIPLDGLSWSLMFKHFSKTCFENTSFIKIRKERRVLYMKTNMHFSSFPSQFFLEWEMFHTKIVEKIKTQIYVQKNFF
jgi:hypothetical protein